MKRNKLVVIFVFSLCIMCFRSACVSAQNSDTYNTNKTSNYSYTLWEEFNSDDDKLTFQIINNTPGSKKVSVSEGPDCSGDIIIPSIINGYTVTYIPDNSFNSRSNKITSMLKLLMNSLFMSVLI